VIHRAFRECGWVRTKKTNNSDNHIFDNKLHYTDARSYNDAPENSVSKLDPRGERSLGVNLARMLTAIGEVGAELE
jgi:hypothetical protein